MNKFDITQLNIYPESLMYYTGKFWIFWKDLNSQYLGCNIHMAKDLLLKSPKDIVGKTDYDFPIPKDIAKHFIQCDQEVIQSRITKQFWDTFMLRDEKKHFVAIKSPLISNNKVIGVYGMSYSRTTPNAELNDSPMSTENIYNLTIRELEVMKYFVSGHTAKEIGKLLSLSYRTIEQHISNTKIKTGCRTRSALTQALLDYFKYKT
ncbi:MAG: LuxR C-terminal-related transcriptional regulator [Gammaproteobacteria bacterium]|nr:LuxR C-terminal-related transcriptional regulator [Gammaproteobacteria bacterium]